MLLLTRLLLCMWLVFSASSAHAEDRLPRYVRDWALVEDGVELTVDLQQVREELSQAVPELAKQYAPAELRGDFEWFERFRFSNLRVQVDEVHFLKGSQADELRVEIKGGLDADREKREVQFPRLVWVQDGTKRVADLKLEGRVRVAATGPQALAVLARADTLQWECLLRPARGASGTVKLESRELRNTEVKVPALGALGVKVVGARVLEVREHEAVMVVELAEVETGEADVEPVRVEEVQRDGEQGQEVEHDE